MLWLVVIPFALGVLLAPTAEVPAWALGVLLAVVLFVSGWLVRKRFQALPSMLVGFFVLGALYANVRFQFAEHQSQSFAEWRSNYRGERAPAGRYVLKAEEYLSTTSLSEDNQAVISAMMLGDRSGLSTDQRDLYRQAGAQHLLALSGFHLGVLLSLLSVLFWRRLRFGRWRWVALALSLSMLWFYAIMVGMPKSMFRAVLMASLFLVGRYSFRNSRATDILASTILLMLLVDPLCAYDVGAQLSVAAMVGLVCFLPSLNALLPEKCAVWIRRPVQLFMVSFSAWLFTMPLALFYFGQIQPWQPLVGVFLVPVTSFVLYGAVLLLLASVVGITVLADLLSPVLDGLMIVQHAAMQFSSRLPLAYAEVGRISLWHVVLLYCLCFVLWTVITHRNSRVLFASLACSAALLALLAWL